MIRRIRSLSLSLFRARFLFCARAAGAFYLAAALLGVAWAAFLSTPIFRVCKYNRFRCVSCGAAHRRADAASNRDVAVATVVPNPLAAAVTAASGSLYSEPAAVTNPLRAASVNSTALAEEELVEAGVVAVPVDASAADDGADDAVAPPSATRASVARASVTRD